MKGIFHIDQFKLPQYKNKLYKNNILISLGVWIIFTSLFVTLSYAQGLDIIAQFLIALLLSVIFLAACISSWYNTKRHTYTSIKIQDGYLMSETIKLVPGKINLTELGVIRKCMIGTLVMKRGVSGAFFSNEEVLRGRKDVIVIPSIIENYQEIISFLKHQKKISRNKH